MSPEQLKSKFPNASPTFIKLNSAVGSVCPDQREPGPKPALEPHLSRKPKGKGRVAVRCSIIVCCHKLYDDDNSISGGTKALRDAIAESVGLDDGDKRIRWHYGQLQTSGEQGVIVRIERT